MPCRVMLAMLPLLTMTPLPSPRWAAAASALAPGHTGGSGIGGITRAVVATPAKFALLLPLPPRCTGPLPLRPPTGLRVGTRSSSGTPLTSVLLVKPQPRRQRPRL